MTRSFLVYGYLFHLRVPLLLLMETSFVVGINEIGMESLKPVSEAVVIVTKEFKSLAYAYTTRVSISQGFFLL